MATFPSIAPTYGAQKTSQPKVTAVQYGDGYEMRAVFGLNQNPKSWALTWEISEANADTIETFLDARAGQESFDWTPPRGTAGKYVCEEWQTTLSNCNNNQIRATFREVYEP